MRLIAILIVMAVIGVLGSRQLSGHHSGTDTVPGAQGVVNGARSALAHAQATGQAQADAETSSVSQP